MKKKLLSLCAGSLLLALLVSSCSKECECVMYEDGVAIGTSIETVWGQTCAEYSSVLDTPSGKMGLECTKKKKK